MKGKASGNGSSKCSTMEMQGDRVGSTLDFGLENCLHVLDSFWSPAIWIACAHAMHRYRTTSISNYIAWWWWWSRHKESFEMEPRLRSILLLAGGATALVFVGNASAARLERLVRRPFEMKA